MLNIFRMKEIGTNALRIQKFIRGRLTLLNITKRFIKLFTATEQKFIWNQFITVTTPVH
jgi:hypothetical protein